MPSLPPELACPLPWPDPAQPLLMARRLTLCQGRRALCREFDLDIRAGQCMAILGRNGAGKTSLLHALAGLHGADRSADAPETQGDILPGGRPYADWPPLQAAKFRGLLPQHQLAQFAASVRETVLAGRHPHLGRWGWESATDVAIAHAALDCVGLQGFASRDLHALSGGEQQRVALATLLTQTPRLFLLDEPLNHLDLHHQIAVMELLRALAADGRGVVMTLHDLALAARYADSVVLLDGEGGVTVGTSGEALTADRLSRAFGHPLRRVEVDGKAVFLPE
ncbi:MAG: ABC transporter ATP-binding protein [Azoarcus sp.]|nr:ABC transporter ATP-binding protein [Azoarcus sp.]